MLLRATVAVAASTLATAAVATAVASAAFATSIAFAVVTAVATATTTNPLDALHGSRGGCARRMDQYRVPRMARKCPP